jgi:CPA2 family monovalent cation:H+ antiporter-2
LDRLANHASTFTVGVLMALGKAALVVAGVVIGARTVVPLLIDEILKTRSRELFLIAVILLGAVTALASSAAGASLALGAFLAGLVISESDYAHQALAELLPLRDVLISLFFVSVGMLVNVHDLVAHPALIAGGVAVVIVGKTLAAAAGPAVVGYSARVSALAGLTVSQIGEFAFVLASAGRALGLMDAELYQSFLTVAVLTILVTPFLLVIGPATLDKVDRLLPAVVRTGRRPPAPVAAPEAELSKHVIIVGYGLNGRNLSTALRAPAWPT